MDENVRAAGEATANNPNDGSIPYRQAYFGCCNRTVMTREDIAQPQFCPFCGRSLAAPPAPASAAPQGTSAAVNPYENAICSHPDKTSPTHVHTHACVEPPVPLEASNRERAKHYLRAGGPHDVATSVEEAVSLLAVELAAAYRRGQEAGVLAEHKSHVDYENELYATLVDPVAEGSIKEAEMRKQLLESARWYRQHVHDLETQLNKTHDAFKRGQEEMRERAAKLADAQREQYLSFTGCKIRALPLSEEKP